MKKILFIIAFLSIVFSSYSQNSEIKEQLKQTTEELQIMRDSVSAVLNQTLEKEILSPGLDEVNRSNNEMDFPTRNDQVLSFEREKLQTLSHLEERKMEAATVIMAIGAPCIAIILIVIIILVFLLKRYRTRAHIIEQAILNNYSLPEGYYTGSPSNHITYIYNNYERKNKNEDTGNENEIISDQPEINNIEMPPIPPKNVFLNLNQMDRSAFNRSLTLAGVGLLIFLFFVGVDATPVGVLAGGIPFIIGSGRFITFYFYKNK